MSVKITVTTLLLLLSIHSVEIINSSLYPRMKNKIASFNFSQHNNSDFKVALKTKCSGMVKRVGLFFTSYDLCDFEVKNESIKNVNTLLSNLTVDLSKEDPKIDFSSSVNSPDL